MRNPIKSDQTRTPQRTKKYDKDWPYLRNIRIPLDIPRNLICDSRKFAQTEQNNIGILSKMNNPIKSDQARTPQRKKKWR